MIYKYKKKTIAAGSVEEACLKLGITLAQFKKDGKQIRYTLAEPKKELPPLSKGKGYEERLNEWESARKSRKTDRNWRQKKLVEELKDNPCSICGYEGVSRARVFHHVEPSEKSFEIRVGRLKQDYLAEEVAKCLLLCRNCHATLHEYMEGEYENAPALVKKFIKEQEKK